MTIIIMTYKVDGSIHLMHFRTFLHPVVVTYIRGVFSELVGKAREVAIVYTDEEKHDGTINLLFTYTIS